jgi:hypothetical protein
MKINKYYFPILIGIISLLFSSCSTVKDAFDPQRKNSSEEFLVEKKSPLSMPPDFDELPVPRNDIDKEKDQDEDIELLITKDVANQKNMDQINNLNEEFLDSILDKIKNN